MVEMIRIKLASGLYDKANCWLDMKNSITWEDFNDISEYISYPDVRKDLKTRIEQLPLAINAFKEYQNALRNECVKAEAAELSGNKHYPYAERKVVLDSILEDKLKGYNTIHLNELPKFI